MSIVHSFERYDDGEGNDNDEEESHVRPLSNPKMFLFLRCLDHLKLRCLDHLKFQYSYHSFMVDLTCVWKRGFHRDGNHKIGGVVNRNDGLTGEIDFTASTSFYSVYQHCHHHQSTPFLILPCR